MATAIWIVSSLLLLTGLFGIWRQHFPFSRWQPVPAWIVEQRVDREQDIIENVGGALGGAVKALIEKDRERWYHRRELSRAEPASRYLQVRRGRPKLFLVERVL